MSNSSVEENMRLMKTLDDAWNSQDWDTFNVRHAEDVIVRWPDQPPTNGIEAHKKEGENFFGAFPDNHVENTPYKVLNGQGEWTCSIAVFIGTHRDPMMGIHGTMIPPTNKKFKVDFCTLAHWKNGKIVEENLFYDQFASKMWKHSGVFKNWDLAIKYIPLTFFCLKLLIEGWCSEML